MVSRAVSWLVLLGIVGYVVYLFVASDVGLLPKLFVGGPVALILVYAIVKWVRNADEPDETPWEQIVEDSRFDRRGSESDPDLEVTVDGRAVSLVAETRQARIHPRRVSRRMGPKKSRFTTAETPVDADDGAVLVYPEPGRFWGWVEQKLLSWGGVEGGWQVPVTVDADAVASAGLDGYRLYASDAELAQQVSTPAIRSALDRTDGDHLAYEDGTVYYERNGNPLDADTLYARAEAVVALADAVAGGFGGDGVEYGSIATDTTE